MSKSRIVRLALSTFMLTTIGCVAPVKLYTGADRPQGEIARLDAKGFLGLIRTQSLQLEYFASSPTHYLHEVEVLPGDAKVRIRFEDKIPSIGGSFVCT